MGRNQHEPGDAIMKTSTACLYYDCTTTYQWLKLSYITNILHFTASREKIAAEDAALEQQQRL